ncbi:IS3 family transposase [Laribacter hongkongensis]|uniref:IS3 family transposase n=1 Tax=Laribacter hongkongensis TaxID=168471 RepID=UPI001EFCA0FC|nr:IS3 family transposase [Laribacter hongkongensis]MCG9077186.1 IS3 family transposase [Laribacter hongkongensis]
MRFRAIQALSGRYPVAPMCQLFRVSRSGYYAWLHRTPSAREMANRQLLREIRLVHAKVNGIYGHRRIHAELLAQGFANGRHRIAGLMQRNGIQVRTRKRWRPVSGGQQLLPVAPNLLQRQFAAGDVNQRWVSDMTYIRTGEGWLCLAVVLDLYSRAIVGWAMHHRMQQERGRAALTMTVTRRKPAREVILHSDRGSQYCAFAYQALLKRHGMVPSHSRAGNCRDNAAMESFFRSLKSERAYLTHYRSYEEARADVFDYIRFDNHKRRHSTLGYLTPVEFERLRSVLSA